MLLKRVAAQLAGALDFLHGRGLVHADVKPDNVLVFDPVCSRVALGDLGLTRPEGSPTPAPPGPLPSAPPELCVLLPPDTLPLRPALDSWVKKRNSFRTMLTMNEFNNPLDALFMRFLEN